jgi:hypothetical protein
LPQKLALALVGLALFFVPSAKADTFNFASCSQIVSSFPASCPGDTLATVLQYQNSNGLVTAYGFEGPGSTALLYPRQLPEPQGLAVTDEKHLIDTPYFINLDLSNLLAHGSNFGTIDFGGWGGSQYKVCLGNTIGALGGNCQIGNYADSEALPILWSDSAYILGITTARSGWDTGLTIQTLAVPEPGTLTLFAAGMIGLLALGLRRNRLVGVHSRS